MAFDFAQLPLSGWIWTGEEAAHLHPDPEIVWFRRELNFAEAPESVRVRLSADSRYKFYVNGKLLSVGPEKGDRQVWFYDTAELSPALTAGKNVLSAIVLRYPLTHAKGNHSVWRTEVPGFYLKGTITRADGTEEALLADGSWRFHKAEQVQILSENPYFAPLQNLENAAGADWAAGWQLPGYDDSTWQAAAPYVEFAVSKAVSPGNLLPRPIPALYQTEKRFAAVTVVRESALPDAAARWDDLLRADAPITLPAHSREVVEITAGELTTGYLNLAFTGGAGATARILCSESYAQPPAQNDPFAPPQPVKKDRTDSQHGQLYGYADTYAPAGYGRPGAEEVYEPFWFRAFRFLRVEIDTADQPLTLARLTYRETGYPLDARTHGKTSDESLDAVWDMSLRTLRRCMHETYEDCPFYEQLQYIMDSRSQMLYTYQVAADDRLARKCMDDFMRSARYDGLLNCSYPSYGPNVIPGFSIYYILMLHDHMLYFGDRELLRRHLPTVDGILEFFRRSLNAQGLVGKVGGHNGRARYWSFIDWVQEWDTGVPNATNAGPITMETLLYIYGLQHAAELCDFLGRRDTASEYRERAQAAQQAVNAHCIGKDGLYQDGPGFEEYSERCQVFAVLTDTCSPAEGRRLMEKITDHYVGQGTAYPRCSVAMAYYLFRALEKTGLYARTERLWDVWREMVANHLTTCVENDTDGRSDCHAWGALLLYELPAVMLGVRPAAPGYGEIRVEPQPGYLTHAEGEVRTPKGTVRVRWALGPDGKPETEGTLLEEQENP